MTSKVRMVLLGACLVGTLLPGCSRSELPAHNFVLAYQRPEKARESGNTLEAAQLACQEEARKKGIASITAIILRRGKTSEADYIECMKKRGYAVAD